LFILTIRHAGSETGILLSWVQQCGFRPPLVSLAVAHERYLAAWLTTGAEFTLNILDDTQTDMIAHFGKGFAQGEDAFGGLDIDRDRGHAPILADALAYLDCRVVDCCRPGDHTLVICEVIRGGLLGDGQPMVHVRKSGAHY
jgi:flavin reductase (DIM6/NTAB) family NADH-FMN oxidoreductase RutF